MPATPGVERLGRGVRGRCPNSDEVRRICRNTPEMAQYTADLAIKHPDELPPNRWRDPEKTLDRQAECVLLIHRRNMIEPVEKIA